LKKSPLACNNHDGIKEAVSLEKGIHAPISIPVSLRDIHSLLPGEKGGGIELIFGADTKHRQGSPFDVGNNTNRIERFHGTLKSRTKVMRGLHTIESARLFMDGWLVHYNFFRPHMSLKDSTPAVVAGIRCPLRNWKDVTEQPFEVTARIPVYRPKTTVRKRPKAKARRKRIGQYHLHE
jgi:hypothetical protein